MGGKPPKEEPAPPPKPVKGIEYFFLFKYQSNNVS